MKLKLIKPVVIQGRPGVLLGSVFEIEDRRGFELLQLRIAEPARDVAPDPIQTREPEVENRDPVVERVPKRAKKSLP